MEPVCLASSSSKQATSPAGHYSQRGPKMEEKNVTTLSATFSVRPPPVRNGDLVVFWIVLGLGTWRNHAPGRKTRKNNFLVLGALWEGGDLAAPKFSPQNRPKSPKIPPLYYIFRFGRPDTLGREITKHWFFGPFWPRSALGT